MPQSGLLPNRANSIINNLSGYTGTVYVGLATTDSNPVVSGDTVTGIVEVTKSAATGYSRVKLDSNLVTAATGGKSYNKAYIKFDEVLPVAGWGTIRYLVFYDAATAGNPIAIAKLASDVPTAQNEMPVFRPGTDFSTANVKLAITMFDGQA